jgi:hypothetical protein
MRTMLALVGAVVLLSLAPVPTAAQTGKVIVVADFANISVDRGLLPSAQLSEVLRTLLQQRLPAPSRVISGDAVRAAMRAQGFTTNDLIYPSRVAAVAQALGADWVVTGTWTQLRFIGRGTVEDPGPAIRQGDVCAVADVEITVMEASTRRRLLEDRFSGRSSGGDLGSLFIAATEALRFAAARIARL